MFPSLYDVCPHVCGIHFQLFSSLGTIKNLVLFSSPLHPSCLCLRCCYVPPLFFLLMSASLYVCSHYSVRLIMVVGLSHILCEYFFNVAGVMSILLVSATGLKSFSSYTAAQRKPSVCNRSVRLLRVCVYLREISHGKVCVSFQALCLCVFVCSFN